LTSSRWDSFRKSSKKASNERYTPDSILNLAVQVLDGIDLDPCADPKKRVPAKKHFTEDDDGLEQAWHGTIFLNPPFSDPGAWLRHLTLYYEAQKVKAALVLVPVIVLGNKSAQHLLKFHSSAITILNRRIRFLDADYRVLPAQLPYPCSLIYLGPNASRFLALTSEMGVPCLVKPSSSERQIFGVCTYCGKPFTGLRSTAKYCSATCRVQQYRKKKQER
jgi:hypothetical protein